MEQNCRKNPLFCRKNFISRRCDRLEMHTRHCSFDNFTHTKLCCMIYPMRQRKSQAPQISRAELPVWRSTAPVAPRIPQMPSRKVWEKLSSAAFGPYFLDKSASWSSIALPQYFLLIFLRVKKNSNIVCLNIKFHYIPYSGTILPDKINLIIHFLTGGAYITAAP